jgi:hypothetical protein
MVRQFLFLIALALLGACAEITPLTGGKKDVFAPKPVDGKQLPEQGAIGWSGQSLTITFDEYFKLNDPTTNIVMNPSTGKLTTAQKNKTLTISWENELAANTTYIVQLNGAVRDLNEGNDSILSLVFSTGMTIDSLHFKGRCSDAFSNEVVGNVSVGLYPTATISLDKQPPYLSRSDAQGVFRMEYLKQGNYQVIGFIDRNKNQQIDSDEPFGFLNGPRSTQDTSAIHLRLYTPKSTTKPFKVAIEQPGIARITGANLDSNTVFINQRPAQILNRFESDSILVALPIGETSNYEFVCKTDTVIRKLPAEKRGARFTILESNKTKKWRIGDTLAFQTTEKIESIDTSLISLKSGNNSIGFSSIFSGNSCFIIPKTTIDAPIAAHVNRGALKGATNENDSISFAYETFSTEELSNLTVVCNNLVGSWIIQLSNGGKIVATQFKSPNQQRVVFNRQFPGQYTLICIEDLNNNGHWDQGDWNTHQQPERVVRFQVKQKLRANWDVEEAITVE